MSQATAMLLAITFGVIWGFCLGVMLMAMQFGRTWRPLLIPLIGSIVACGNLASFALGAH